MKKVKNIKDVEELASKKASKNHSIIIIILGAILLGLILLKKKADAKTTIESNDGRLYPNLPPEYRPLPDNQKMGGAIPKECLNGSETYTYNGQKFTCAKQWGV